MNLSIDFGYGWIKALKSDSFVTFPHAIGTPDPIRFRDNSAVHAITIKRDDETKSYYVGNEAILQSRHSWTHVARKRDKWELRAFLAYSCDQLNLREIDTVVSGLPVAWYAEDQDEHIDAIRGTLAYQYKSDAWKEINVKNVKVLPQPMGTYHYAAQDNPDIAESDFICGIIDIGHFTTDCVRVQGGEYLAPDSFSIPVGIKRLQDDLIAIVQQAYQRELTQTQADKALRQGYVKIRGEQKPLLLESATTALAQEIISRIDSMWQGAYGLDGILVTGGGSHLLFDAIHEVYPHAVKVDEPETANVRGYAIYGG